MIKKQYLYIFFRSITFVFLVLSWSFSCQSPKGQPFYASSASVDSVCDTVQNIDSLLYWEEYYRNSKNTSAEMCVTACLADRYGERSNFTEALALYTRSLALSQQLKDTANIIRSMNGMGTSYRHLGMVTQSASLYFRALIFSNQWSRTNTTQGLTLRVLALNGIGEVQMSMRNYVRAEKAFRSALAGDEQLGNVLGQAVDYANLGAIKAVYGERDSAFWYYERSLDLNRAAQSKVGVSMCYNHFGSLAETQGDWDAALRYYYRAYELLKNTDEGWYMAKVCLLMANVYLKRNDMVHAKQYIDEGWAAAKGMKSWELMSKAALLMAQFEEENHRYSSALYWHKEGDGYADSVMNEKNRSKVSQLMDQYTQERTFKEMENLRQHYKEEKSKKMKAVWWGILLSVVILLISIFLVYILRARNKKQEMINRIDQVRTDFLKNVSHEIRTPLTVMLGLGKQIADGNLSPNEKDCRNLGKMIVRQGDVMLRLVSQLLDLSRAKSDRGMEDWRTGNIVPFVTMITENSRAYAQQMQVYFAYVCDESDIQMDFVPEYVRKILQNLLLNAVKYSGVSGKVSVQMSREGKYLRIALKDSGRGMAEKDLPHIFDPFYTASNLTIEMSTGVGLAVVREMIEAMKGKISVRSQLGVGTEFIILLPLKYGRGHWPTVDQSEVDMAKKYTYPQPSGGVHPESSTNNTTQPCILVIEDNRDVATYIGMQLSQYYRVIYAVNGKEGLEKAQDVMPDLIVSDLMMPGLDGNEVCKAVRTSEALNHIPVIIISAKSGEEDRLKGLEMGADAYLNKPFNAHELLVIINNLLEQRKSLRQKYAVDVSNGYSNTSGLKQHERDFLRRLIDVVYHEMSHGNLDSESLASAMCMSSSQLRRKVFALSGEKLNGFVLHIRLNHACQLLINQTDMPVGDVASRCGFEDAAYFSRIFKQAYQVTPSRYRRQAVLKERSLN